MRAQFYSSSDPDAPVLNGDPGSLINLLDAILVNGYGVKEPLGWTKEFSGTNIAVYRNSTSDPLSSGMYLRVDNSTGYNLPGIFQVTRCLVRGYKTMSDIDTGTDPTHECFWNSVAGSNTAQDWYCVGDHRTFYLNRSNKLSSYSYLLSSIFAAGDYKSYVPVNPYNYFVTKDRTDYTSSSSGIFPAGNQTITIPRPGSFESVAIWCSPEFPPGTSWLSVPGGDRQFQTFRIVQASNGVYAVGELRGVLVTREDLGGQTSIYPSGTNMGSNPFSPGEDLTNLRANSWTTSNAGHIQVSSGEWDG